MRRRLAATAVVAAALAVAAGCAESDPGGAAPAEAEAAVVVRGVDGDTLIVRGPAGEERVRLVGIDAPESVTPDVPPECFGDRASARLSDLLPRGAQVTLATDARQGPRDRFGRRLAYVTSERGVDVNLDLLRTGHARVLVVGGGVTRLDAFRAAEREARSARRGLWGACAGGGGAPARAPSGPSGRACPDEAPIKGNLPSMIFHRPGDPSYEETNPERCFATAEDATAAGFRPARD